MNSASPMHRERGTGNGERGKAFFPHPSSLSPHPSRAAQLRLHAWAYARLGAPFAWGATDCWMLCAEALDRLHGSSVAAAWRNSWTSAREAVRAARDLPVADLLHALGLSVIPHPSSFIPRGSPLAGDLLIAMPPARRFFFAHVALGNGWALSSSVAHGVGLMPVDDVLDIPGIALWRRQSVNRESGIGNGERGKAFYPNPQSPIPNPGFSGVL